jgi:hypothetical protein
MWITDRIILSSAKVLLKLFGQIKLKVTASLDGFGGLVVSMLASGSRVRGFKRGRSRWIFLHVKILSLPSFGGEVK